MLAVLEANHHFYEYYKPYIHSEWKQEYFAYDHFKHLYKVIKSKEQYSHSQEIFHDFQLQCYEEIKRVHKFIVTAIHEIDMDLTAVNDMLGKEGIDSKPSVLRVSLAASAFPDTTDLDEDNDDNGGDAESLDSRKHSFARSINSGRSHSQFRKSNTVSSALKPILGLTADEDSHHSHPSQIQSLQKAASLNPNDADRDHSIELALRNIYTRIKEIDKFYQLNYFVIRKISKKMEKLIKIGKFHQQLLQIIPSSLPTTSSESKSEISENHETDRSSNSHGSGTLSLRQRESVSLSQHQQDRAANPTSNLVATLIGNSSEKYLDRVLKEGGPHVAIDPRKSMSIETEIDLEAAKHSSVQSDISMITTVPLLKGWKETMSGSYFHEEFIQSKEVIDEMKKECVAIYTKKFRKTYSDLAPFELEYVKERDHTDNTTNLFVGLKLGLIICVALWVLADSYTTKNDFDFWNQPGLYVYTTIGNLLLYRLCWAANIYIWAKFDVNYISILRMKNLKPNLLLVIDQTATLLGLYFLNLLIFFRANSSDTLLDNSFLSYGCPLVLLIVSIFYQFYEYFYLFGNERISRGVFSRRVLRHCLKAPFVPVTFREVYAADVLTSFTRIIADSLYASCWVFSGAFLIPHDGNDDGRESSNTSFGSSYMHCTNHNMLYVVSIVQMWPLIIRTLQCLRSMRDSKWNIYPQGYNAVKYLLSVAVVIIGLQDSTDTGVYFFFIALSTLYKWWWDVVMDWGLFDVLPTNLCDLLDIYSYPQKKMFLRKSLMYPRENVYYVCIVIDLVLRFLWVLSTLPQSSLHNLVGYQLSFFLGSMEILRRCMWGMLRVEYEHLKMLKNKTPGFLSNHILRKHEHPDIIGKDDGYESDDDPSKALKKIKDKKKIQKHKHDGHELHGTSKQRFISRDGPTKEGKHSPEKSHAGVVELSGGEIEGYDDSTSSDSEKKSSGKSTVTVDHGTANPMFIHKS